MGKLTGKRILVTGGSSGIGKAIVLGYLAEGAEVAFTYNKSEESAKELCLTAEQAGATVHPLHAQLEDHNSAIEVFERAIDAMGGINVLVNNAATTTRSPFIDISYEEFNRIFALNFIVPFFLAQRFCNYVLSNKIIVISNPSIINISSLSAEKAVSRIAHYQCSKAALSMLTRSVALEMADKGIRINTISPGLTQTPGNEVQRHTSSEVWEKRLSQIPMGRAGMPEDHVGAAIFFASDESLWITGANLIIDGGQSVI